MIPPAPLAPITLLSIVLAGASPLAAGDQPVSFANDVAPVLVNQCLVCHNARTSKGRFSVETFASLMKGGESGEAISPSDADLSSLVLLVESGEMPKDGDRLPAEQVAVLKNWIAQGAKLDEGKRADRPLSAIMPKPPQPMPPEVYPAPVPVTALAFDPDGSRLAVSGYHELLVFDPQDGRLISRFQNIAERIHAVAFNPDGELLAVAAGTPARLGEVKLLQSETGELVADLASAGDSFFDVAFSPDGAKLAAAGADRSVRVWSVADFSELIRIEDHADWVTAVAFSPDGSRLATASRDTTAKVFDLGTGESLATFSGHEQVVFDVLFGPDGDRVVSCGQDNRVRIWNASDAKEQRREELRGEGFALARVGSDGFLCGSADRTARLFGFDGQQRKSYDDRPDWVEAVAATDDGSLIAIGTYDGTVAVLRAEKGEPVSVFSAMPPKP